MKTRSKYALSAIAAASTLLTGVIAVPGSGFAEEPDTLAAAYDRMDSTIEGLEKQAAEIQVQIADTQQKITSIQGEIAEIDRITERDQEALKELIHGAYVTGDFDALEALVANGSLSDLIRQQHQDDVLSEKIGEILESILKNREEKSAKLADLEKKRDGLVTLKESVDKALGAKKEEERKKAALREMTLDREDLYQRVRDQEASDVVATVSNTSQGQSSGGGSGYSGGGANGLMGSIGIAKPCLPSGQNCNCVNEPGVNRASGDPISWQPTTQTPRIGATALWHYNHTGVVVGIWSNGDIEVRHQNFWGGEHRFPRSAFRGFR